MLMDESPDICPAKSVTALSSALDAAALATPAKEAPDIPSHSTAMISKSSSYVGIPSSDADFYAKYN